MKITLRKELKGRILDIGDGGEAIISRLYGENVVAIDNCQGELDEIPFACRKILMDATALAFDDASFSHVTAFYSLMFMNQQEQEKAIMEASRVLEQGGQLHIWDCDIESAYPEPFCVNLDICLPNERVSTTYGICKYGEQNKDSIVSMCMNAGLTLLYAEEADNGFFLKFKKSGIPRRKEV